MSAAPASIVMGGSRRIPLRTHESQRRLRGAQLRLATARHAALDREDSHRVETGYFCVTRRRAPLAVSEENRMTPFDEPLEFVPVSKEEARKAFDGEKRPVI